MCTLGPLFHSNISKLQESQTPGLQNSKFHYLLLTLSLLLCTCVRAQVPEPPPRHVPVLTAATFFAELPADLRSSTLPDAALVPRMPWIERYEFRSETRDLDPSSQEYALRLIPNTPGKRRAQRRLAELTAAGTALPNDDLTEAQADYVADRYATWLDAYGLQREIALIDELLLVLQDRQTVLERRAAAYEIDWADFISIRTERTDLRLRRTSTLNEQRQLIARFGFTYDSLDLSNFAELESLTAPGAPPEEIAGRYAAERSLIEAELDLEVAEQRQYLDFVQFKFQGPREDEFNERFSVGFGLQLPNQGNSRLKIQELEAELRTLSVEEKVERFAAQRDLNELRYKARLRRDRFEEQRRAYATEATDLAEVARRIQTAQSPDPELLLRLRERELRNELRLLEARLDLGHDYLDLLEEGGWLTGRDRGEYLRRP